MEKGKISSAQMGMMIYIFVLATGVLSIPAITGIHAGRDLWLSPILATPVGFLTAYIAIQLNKYYPKENLIQFSKHILGPFFGGILAFVYVCALLHFCGNILRAYGEFVVGIVLPKTPMLFVIGSFALLCAFTVQAGLEVIGRTTQFFFPIYVIPLFTLFLFLFQDLHPENMLPILENGLLPPFMGSIVPQSWFGEYIFLSFLLPHISNREKIKKISYLSIIGCTLTMVIVNLTILFLYGERGANLLFPIVSAARYISIADFFEHLDAIIVAIWITSIFIKINVLYYSVVVGTAHLFKLSDYRPIVFPIVFISVLISIWTAPNMQHFLRAFGTAYPFHLLLLETVIPMILLLIAMVKNRKQQTKR